MEIIMQECESDRNIDLLCNLLNSFLLNEISYYPHRQIIIRQIKIISLGKSLEIRVCRDII